MNVKQDGYDMDRQRSKQFFQERNQQNKGPVKQPSNEKKAERNPETSQTGSITGPLLEVNDFSVQFPQYERGMKQTTAEGIRQIDLSIYPGEIVAVVGASGSGKSLLADAVLGILPAHVKKGGNIRYKGTSLTPERQAALRGREIALIPQSVNALDPLMKVKKQVRTSVSKINHNGSKQQRRLFPALSKWQAEKRWQKAEQTKVFEQMGLQPSVENQYPFQLSGGMKRRILVAAAMVSRADLIIADEPTPGLDPQALTSMMSRLKQLVTKDKAMMFITHDLEAALQIAHRIVVFYEGENVETVSPTHFLQKEYHFQHPYTRALFNARPRKSFTASPAGEKSVGHGEEQLAKSQGEKLHITGVSYQYSHGPSLFTNVEMTISPGEIVGLFGGSGVGKSTFAQIIAGYFAATEGEIFIGNQEISSRKAHPVQLIMQHPEKVMNPRWRMKRLLDEVNGLDQYTMDLLGIQQAWLNRYPSELSGGELQRFAIARAIAADAKYIIADEITTMLDTVAQADIWHLLLTFAKERNIGILAISHDHALLERVADRVQAFHQLSNDKKVSK